MPPSVIGNGSPTSTINYTSDAGNLIDLTKFLAGKTATTSGTTGEAVQGQTGPLEALLAQTSDPNNLLNIVQALFSQGASQVPALTTQYANATGTRVSNNGMLGMSLAQLSQTLAQAIATQIIQQQQTAVNAASTLAQTNKTKATTNAQATKEQGNAGRASGLGGAILGGGMILNKFGDKILDKASSVFSPNSSSVAVGPQVYPDFPTTDMPGPVYAGGSIDPFSNLTNAGFDIAAPSIALDAASGTVDGLAGLDTAVDGTVATDAMGGLDATTDFSNATDVASTVSDASSIPADLFDFGFADGGTVLPAPAQASALVRNRPFIPQFSAIPTPVGVAPQIQQPVPIQPQSMVASKPVVNKKAKGPLDATSGDSIDSGTGADANASGGPSGSMSFSPGAAALAGLAAFALTGNPAAGLFAATKSSLTQDLVSNLVSTLTNPTAVTMPAAVEDADLAAAGMMPSAPDAAAMAAATGMMPSANIASAADLTGEVGSEDSFGADFGSSVEGGTDSGSDAGGADAGGGDAGGGGDSGGGGGGDSGGFADGGAITPLRQRRAGVDTMTIKATPGEVVLPVDVADYIGRDTLDALIEMVHVPIRSGTRG